MDLVSKQREERKQRILEVGRRQIAAHGFDGVTMRELAEESLVSVPTLYNLFGGKNELLSAVWGLDWAKDVGQVAKLFVKG